MGDHRRKSDSPHRRERTPLMVKLFQFRGLYVWILYVQVQVQVQSIWSLVLVWPTRRILYYWFLIQNASYSQDPSTWEAKIADCPILACIISEIYSAGGAPGRWWDPRFCALLAYIFYRLGGLQIEKKLIKILLFYRPQSCEKSETLEVIRKHSGTVLSIFLIRSTGGRMSCYCTYCGGCQ